MIGHRGRSSMLPENSRNSIIAALNDADGSEFDVQRTADNVMIVLHDDTLARTAVPWRPLGCRTQGLHPEVKHSAEVIGTSGLNREDYLKLVNTNVNELTFEQICRVRIGRQVFLSERFNNPLLGSYLDFI